LVRRHPFRPCRCRLKLPVQPVGTNREPMVRMSRGDVSPYAFT
jgi:hypothetical protein